METNKNKRELHFLKQKQTGHTDKEIVTRNIKNKKQKCHKFCHPFYTLSYVLLISKLSYTQPLCGGH